LFCSWSWARQHPALPLIVIPLKLLLYLEMEIIECMSEERLLGD
jgi:hypothetical protein